jgi:hypothetical protein
LFSHTFDRIAPAWQVGAGLVAVIPAGLQRDAAAEEDWRTNENGLDLGAATRASESDEVLVPPVVAAALLRLVARREDAMGPMIIDYRNTGLTGFIPDEFPEAHDFTVELTVWGEDRGEESLNLAYIVSSPATRICWGWWSQPVARIRAWTLADIPCGTIEAPYFDSDQGWNILVWQMDDQIFVAEGDGEWDEERNQDTYTRWFKVSRELYEAGWTAALDRLRAG